MDIPALVALALQADGWYFRSSIIWAKPNPMPESARDRPTSAHEHVFLLSKRDRYFYDADAIREAPSAALIEQVNAGYGGKDTKEYAAAGAQSASGTKSRIIENARAKIDKQRGHGRRHAGFNDRWDAMSRDEQMAIGSNARNVWTIATRPFSSSYLDFAGADYVDDHGTPRKLSPDCPVHGLRGLLQQGTRASVSCGGPAAHPCTRTSRTRSGKSSSNNKCLCAISKGSHFATMPPELAERCIKAGSKPGDTVLDPFGGAGTTGLVADRLNRNAVLIELNPDYRTLAADRLRHDAPLLAVVA